MVAPIGNANVEVAQASAVGTDGIYIGGLTVVPGTYLPYQQEFANAIKSKYNKDGTVHHQHGCDAVLLIAKALAQATDVNSRVAVRDAFESIKGFQGAGGMYSYSATNHVGLQVGSLIYCQVHNGA